ncbi:MAG TPA: hypothetical protein VGF75_06755, partial [Candidatus Saccharimonadales bacterium]
MAVPASSVLVPGMNSQTPALIADKVLSYSASPGIPASGPGGVATFTTVDVGGVQVPASAALEIQSTSGAFIMPRMSQDQRLALVATNGMQVYELDSQAVWWYLNGGWTQVNPTGGGGGDISGPGASTVNAIVSWNNNLGTTVKDNKAVIATSGLDANASDLTLIATIQASKGADTAGATPNYSFTGDVGTGMWSSGANVLDFSTTAASQFRIAGVANAVNRILISGAATGLAPVNAALIKSSGGDAQVDIGFKSHGNASGISILTNDANTISPLKFWDLNSSNYVAFKANDNIAANVTWTLPNVDGAVNQVLSTNGAGLLSWANSGTGNVSFTGAVPAVTNIAIYNNNTGTLIESSPVTINPVSGAITITAAGNTGVINTKLGAGDLAAYGFAGDADTGIWSSGAGVLNFISNSAAEFRIGVLDGIGAGAVNFINVAGNTGNGSPQFSTTASAGDPVGLSIRTKGNSALEIHSDSTAGEIRLYQTGGANYVGFQAPNGGATDVAWTLPGADGTNGQVLSTTGAGVLQFSDALTIASPATNRTMVVFNGTSGAVFPNSGMTVGADGTITNVTGSGTGRIIQSEGDDTNPTYSFVGALDVGMYTDGTQALFAASGATQFGVGATASAVNYLKVSGAATTNPPVLSVVGTDPNISMILQSKGGGAFGFEAGTDQQFLITSTASSVNVFDVTGGTAGNGPTLKTFGSDTDISANFLAKGLGTYTFGNVTNGAQLQIIDSGAPTTGWITIRGSATGAATTPTIGVAGSATDIDIVIETQGTAGLALANSTVGGTLALLNAGGTAACAITIDPAFVGEHNIQLPNITAPAGNYFIQATRVDAVNTTLS